MKSLFPFFSVLIFSGSCLAGESHPKVTWGGFVDTQYAVDFNDPPNGDRAYSTQPARSNEFNLNLAHIEVNVDAEKLRGRLALQAGTSVQSNSAAEPRRGLVSGPDLSRHIQEARLGYRVSDKTWLDAGVFFAHVGAESWISSDNLTLSRSLVADFSPYYLSGVKLNHWASDALSFQLLIVNGWQIISENNAQKTLGTGVEYSFGHYSLAYNTLFGDEVSADLNGAPRSAEFRHFHNLILRGQNSESFEWAAQFDVGFQQRPSQADFSQWIGASLMGRYNFGQGQKINLRLEGFSDPEQVIVVTGRSEGFQVYGVSVGFDRFLEHGLLWRTEVRHLTSKDRVFPEGSGDFSNQNSTFSTSFAMAF